jgi:hypothetical protein
MMNRYLVPLKYLVNSNSHSNFKFEGKIKFITVKMSNFTFDKFSVAKSKISKVFLYFLYKIIDFSEFC